MQLFDSVPSELVSSEPLPSEQVVLPRATELAVPGVQVSRAEPRIDVPRVERRILAVVLPELLHELALQRSFRAATVGDATALEPKTSTKQLELPASGFSPLPQLCDSRAPRVPSQPELPLKAGPQKNLPRQPMPRARSKRGEATLAPRAVVLTDALRSMLEPTARLDAVNAAARRSGVSTRHTVAQATAIIENLQVCVLPPACVTRALQQVAEAALAFGSPVSFRAPDTVWVDVSGTCQLFGGEHELALALRAHVRALGHLACVAVAPGPWLARAFASHADFDETGILCIPASEAEARSGSLPIRALPLSDDVVAWCARLGLLTLDDLRKLPAGALAARIEAHGFERTLDLIRGRDDGVLDAHLPEELPSEEQSWDFPLDNIEPLLFVLKGLSARLGSRLEGRGQAAQELKLTVQYDKGIVALRRREGRLLSDEHLRRAPTPTAAHRPLDRGADSPPHDSLQITFRLASPLSHAEDLERIVRSRLQREALFAPASALRLQVTAITEAQQWQQSLNVDGGLGVTLSSDPRTLAVLVAELSADIGADAVGRLETRDSHLLEKSSQFVPVHRLALEGRSERMASAKRAGGTASDDGRQNHGETVARVPTRLLSPIEFSAPLKEDEIVVIERRAFVIESIEFEERLEAVEWWAPTPVSRDYFRLWLAIPSSAGPNGAWNPGSNGASAHVRKGLSLRSRAHDGVEVLVFLNRDDGKKYIQAIYD